MIENDLKFNFEENDFKFSKEDIVEHCFKKDANSIPTFYNLLSFGDLIENTTVRKLFCYNLHI